MTAIEELLIEHACLKLMTAYNVRLDNGDHEGFAEVFTEDGIWKQLNEPLIEIKGRQRISKFALNLPKAKINRHMLLNPLVTVLDRDHAEGFCIGLVVDGPAGDGTLPVPVSSGGVELVAEYRDVYRRDADGWHIARREMTRIMDQKAVVNVPD